MRDYVEKIVEIIKENFSNGIRDDFIDTNKVLRIYLAKYPEEKISRNFIVNVIHSQGIETGGRFYFVSEGDIAKIISFFGEILKNHSVVFYSVVYNNYAKFFSDLNIFSPEVLKKVLQENDGENFYFDEFCSTNKTARLDYEISKIFMGSDSPLSAEDLQKIFPCVTEEKILSELNTKKYLPTVSGKYFPVSKIKFDDKEIFAAEKKISKVIEEKKFAVPEDYDLSLNFELNPEIDEKILLELIYEKFFADKFALRGRKLFKRSGKTTANSIKDAVENFLADKDEISVSDLLNYAKKKFPSNKNYSIVLNYCFKFMVRVDENLFVKDSLINFDVVGIDDALTPFVKNKIIPLRAVTSFTGFPPVEGFSWNLFLLASFLRKYSKNFSYSVLNSNSTNIGAIYPKSMNFDNYLDLQAQVIIQEKISLEKSAVENFLVGQGFRAKKIDKAAQRIIDRAQEILNL